MAQVQGLTHLGVGGSEGGQERILTVQICDVKCFRQGVDRVVADVWEKDVWEFQAKSGSSGSCRFFFLYFLAKIADILRNVWENIGNR